jgi:hypothetical protein
VPSPFGGRARLRLDEFGERILKDGAVRTSACPTTCHGGRGPTLTSPSPRKVPIGASRRVGDASCRVGGMAIPWLVTTFSAGRWCGNRMTSATA